MNQTGTLPVETISVEPQTRVSLISQAKLPTKWGLFTIYGFLDHKDGKEHTALVNGNVNAVEDCPLRIHSECHTGDIWGSLRCDCREQLEASLEYVNRQPVGAVIYLRQEGRGIGLLNKLKAYNLQDQGLDTVDANRQLGLPDDAREYQAAAEIINLLGISSVALLTNNPLKLTGLQKQGILVTRRLPLIIPSNTHNHRYLKTKQVRMGHLLD